MELKPREFEELQPHEFYLLLEGYMWRRKDTENILAYFLTPLVNAPGALKKPFTASDYLAPLRQEEVKTQKRKDAEYLRQLFPSELK